MTPSEIHDKFTAAYMMGTFRDLLHANVTSSEVLVFLESITLGTLLTLEKHYGLTRQETVEALDILQLAVLERLAGSKS